MPGAVILSEDTFKRVMKMLEDYENGYEKSIQLGEGLKVEERGTGYVKIGIDGTECPS
jgi:PHD/YefM family antitoxin component YafN of YafNO toxin-antitoxin module